MSIRNIISKYESLLKEDKYEEVFKKCSSDERVELLEFMYNKAGINPLLSMTTIPPRLFTSCRISAIEIPNNITSIEYEAFKDSNVISVYMNDVIKEIGPSTFLGCKSLSTIRLSRALEKIPNNAFNGCTSLEKIFIPDSVKMIGNGAFKNCSDNIIIVANFRAGDDKIRFSGADIDFYKTHMKFKRK